MRITTLLLAATASVALLYPSDGRAQETFSLTFQSAYPSGDPQKSPDQLGSKELRR